MYRRNTDGSWPASPLATPTASQWSDSGLTNGVNYTYRVTAGDAAGNQSPPSVVASATPVGGPATGDPVVAAAGDIACDPLSSSFNNGLGTSSSCRQKYTSDLLVGAQLAAVLALGDIQYEDGTLAQFQQSYDRSWGRVKDITYPAVGNHEYQTPKAAGYFDYFNGVGVQTGRAGDRTKGYYSFNIGSWHIVTLNSNCSQVGGCGAGSPRRPGSGRTSRPTPRAARSPTGTTRASAPASTGIPRRCSRCGRRSTTRTRTWCWPATTTATSASRRRRRPAWRIGTRGIREFVVGTGGKSHYAFTTARPNSLVRESQTYGVLELTLHAAELRLAIRARGRWDLCRQWLGGVPLRRA